MAIIEVKESDDGCCPCCNYAFDTTTWLERAYMESSDTAKTQCPNCCEHLEMEITLRFERSVNAQF